MFLRLSAIPIVSLMILAGCDGPSARSGPEQLTARPSTQPSSTIASAGSATQPADDDLAELILQRTRSEQGRRLAAKIQMGASREQVETLLGAPDAEVIHGNFFRIIDYGRYNVRVEYDKENQVTAIEPYQVSIIHKGTEAMDQLPADAQPRSRYKREIAYEMSLGKLSPAEAALKGRERAERDYAAGWGETDLYGLRLFVAGPLVDEMGLYANLSGCAVESVKEVDSYNERLRQLVKQNGLPRNARLLSGQIIQIKAFLKKAPPLRWVELGTFEEKTGEWKRFGPYVVRWNFAFSVLPGKEQEKSAYLEIQGTPETLEVHLPHEPEPLQMAYWPEAKLLMIATADHQHIDFWDVVYSRRVYVHDGRFESLRWALTDEG